MSENKAVSPYVELNQQFAVREGEFAKALPSHIPPQRFTRVVMTAVQKDVELLRADRKSLFQACLQCAQDGLLPDGRDAALVVYKGVVSYQPMIAGIRKKVRQSGEIATWEAHVAYENDDFQIVLGDDERIRHVPLLKGDRGEPVAVYSRAVFKDGFVSRDWMTIAQVEAIRRRAKTQKIWGDPDFYPEMVKKTMLRRHSKSLPLSAELDRLMQREDESYDLGSLTQRPPEAPRVAQEPRHAIEDHSSDSHSGNGQEAPAKRRGRPSLADVAAREAAERRAGGNGVIEAEAEEDNPALRGATRAEMESAGDIDHGDEAVSQQTAQPSQHMDADYFSMGYDAFFDGKDLRPFPLECRGVANKAKAALYEKGFKAAERENTVEGDNADTASAE